MSYLTCCKYCGEEEPCNCDVSMLEHLKPSVDAYNKLLEKYSPYNIIDMDGDSYTKEEIKHLISGLQYMVDHSNPDSLFASKMSFSGDENIIDVFFKQVTVLENIKLNFIVKE